MGSRPGIARWLRFTAFAVMCCAGAGMAEGDAASPADVAAVRTAIERSLPYLAREGEKWMEERKCVSCHQITSMLWSMSAARQRGFAVDDSKLDSWYRWSAERTREVRDDPKRNLAAENMIKLMLGRSGYESGKSDLFVEYPGEIMAMQQEEGHWKAGGQLPFQRRPERETNEVSTMWAMLALAKPGTSGAEASRAKAAAWIGRGEREEVSTEWVALRVLLAQGEGEAPGREWLAKLLERQREDGGWAFIGDQESDALATGTALYALSRVRGPGVGEAVRRARVFLVGSQQEDGHWIVPTTKKPKKDEPAGMATDVSNYWGSAWAVIGLAETLGE